MEIKQSFIDVGRPNRPGFPMEAKWITIHNTDNTEPGADAHAHSRYLQTTDRKVSWHFTVDDIFVYQHLPINEAGYHAGDGQDGPGNRTSIGIEICMYQGIDQDKANWLAIDLIVYLLKTLGLDVGAVVPHKKWTGKNCPALIISWWDDFIVSVKSKIPPEEETSIAGVSQAEVGQAQTWARARGATEDFISIAPIYWRIGQQAGIRPEVAFAQSAKETGFGRFGGVVDRSFNNWCGLKTAEGGDNGDPEAHARFADDSTGILAHIQHLAAYAGLDVASGIVDPRYHLVNKGSAQTVEALGGRWAPSPDYGRSIVRDYLSPLMETKAEPEPGPPAWDPVREIARLKERGLIYELREPDQAVNWGELAAVLNRVLDKPG